MATQHFDSERNPFDDVHQALEQARQAKKNVLLDLGGDWCVWCHRLEAFIQDHAELQQLREQHYITVKVYVGDADEPHKQFFQRLPSFDGVPHLFVYNSRGELLCSQDTAVLEADESYDYERVKTFLATWSDWRLTPYDALSTAELKRRFEQRVFSSSDSGLTTSA